MIATLIEGDIKGAGYGRLSGTTEAREPQKAGTLVLRFGALGAGNFMVVPDDVSAQNRTLWRA